MKRQVKIVIGANYGDEGKGLMSRYFSKKFLDEGCDTVTVLHNGSAQRGHTADYEDGSRHVFHNFGAGAKDGAATYYADTFMVHPMDFAREVNELGFVPKVYCDPNCVVVTPFDMIADNIIEDAIEQRKGKREYGSCCYGTWSTTDRIMNRPDIAYTVADYSHSFAQKMDNLVAWMMERIRQHGVQYDEIRRPWRDYIVDPNIMRDLKRRFHLDLLFFKHDVNVSSFEEIWSNYNAIVFEGAQGLLLNQDPLKIWTTTSHTGLRNPVKMLGERDFDAEVCYVSRSYLTRHGAGPLPGEKPKEWIGNIKEDQTNLFNWFQGPLRYAELNTWELANRIRDDYLACAKEDKRYHIKVAYTHCNEVEIHGGDYRSYSPYSVIEM